MNIVIQRISGAMEELGLIDELIHLIKGFGFAEQLKQLDDEKAALLEKQKSLNEQISVLSKGLVDLQMA